jgi:hypothetical protein
MIFKRSKLNAAKDSKPLEEKIAKIKRIVYRTLVDESTVKLLGEKEKSKLFAKMGFLKPKNEDIQLESLEKSYDPFFIVNGTYSIDYYRKQVYKLDVGEDVSELVIFGQVLKPKAAGSSKFRGKAKEVELEVEQRIVKGNSAYIVLDRKGREVEVEKFPTAPAEEKPKKALAEVGERVWEFEVSPEEAIEIVRSKVVNRPEDLGRIANELFEVSECNIVYVPVYQAMYKNVNTWEEKTLLVNAVTSEPMERADQAS